MILKRMGKSAHRRWKNMWDAQVAPAIARDIAEFRWIFSPSPRPHRLSAPVVVSLTSYPPRFPTLALTVKTLLRQSVKADRTVLWIAHDDMRLLPEEVLRLEKSGLDVRAVPDMRSYKKILPALGAFPEAYVCTADDDMYYWPTWLEEMVCALEPGRMLVPCHRAHRIRRDLDGRLEPYNSWDVDVAFRGESSDLFPTGCMGVLYPPGALMHEDADVEAAMRICPDGDDIWLYWIGQKNGASYRTVGRKRRRMTTWSGSQEVSLWSSNGEGGNDAQIEAMGSAYGYPIAMCGRGSLGLILHPTSGGAEPSFACKNNSRHRHQGTGPIKVVSLGGTNASPRRA